MDSRLPLHLKFAATLPCEGLKNATYSGVIHNECYS